jgi:asparagine synthase (glutamine-hydrolysing)
VGQRGELYNKLLSFWDDVHEVVPGSNAVPSFYEWENKELSFFELMQSVDTMTYLTDDIMTKVDRASMAVSLEAREPLLDHRLFEFAWSLPRSFKVRGDKGKWLLRELLKRYIPAALVERPKMGFAVPIEEWLRGPLREWAEDLLSTQSLEREGFFAPHAIRSEWDKHLSGVRDRSYLVWSVLMFQSWRQNWQ